MLWAIWCKWVEIAYREEQFHLGAVLWQAWRNTIYCAMEAYKELFRHARNEEKRQEIISCFRKVWTQAEVFGRMRGGDLRWNLTPHAEFLPVELGAWNSTPIRQNRLSPSPDPEANFTARPDFPSLVDDFLQGINTNNVPEETHQTDEMPGYQMEERLLLQDGNNIAPASEYEEDSNLPEPCGQAHWHHSRSSSLEPPSRNQPSTSQAHYSSRSNTAGHKRKRTAHEDKENIPPDMSAAHNTPPLNDTHCQNAHHPSTSRPKRKCYRKRRATHPLNAIGEEPALRNAPEVTETGSTTENHPPESPKHKPRSRHKKRCRFGPGRHNFTHSRDREERRIPPDTPTTGISPAGWNHTIQTGLGENPWHSSNAHLQRHPEELIPLPSRTTLTPPYQQRQLPFARYRNRQKGLRPPSPSPEPYPHRFTIKKLGLSEAEFENEISKEVDELLTEIEAERRQALLEELPLKVLTKEDCRRMFDPHNPPSGSLRGVFRWAFTPDEDCSHASRSDADQSPRPPTEPSSSHSAPAR